MMIGKKKFANFRANLSADAIVRYVGVLAGFLFSIYVYGFQSSLKLALCTIALLIYMDVIVETYLLFKTKARKYFLLRVIATPAITVLCYFLIPIKALLLAA